MRRRNTCQRVEFLVIINQGTRNQTRKRKKNEKKRKNNGNSIMIFQKTVYINKKNFHVFPVSTSSPLLKLRFLIPSQNLSLFFFVQLAPISAKFCLLIFRSHLSGSFPESVYTTYSLEIRLTRSIYFYIICYLIF